MMPVVIRTQDPPANYPPVREAELQIAMAWASLAAVRSSVICRQRVTVLKPFTLSSERGS